LSNDECMAVKEVLRLNKLDHTEAFNVELTDLIVLDLIVKQFEGTRCIHHIYLPCSWIFYFVEFYHFITCRVFSYRIVYGLLWSAMCREVVSE